MRIPHKVLALLTLGVSALANAAPPNPAEDFYRCTVQLLYRSNGFVLGIEVKDSGGANVAQTAFRRRNEQVGRVRYRKNLQRAQGTFVIPNPGLAGAGPLAVGSYQADSGSGLSLEVSSLRDPRIVVRGQIGTEAPTRFTLPNFFPRDLYLPVEALRGQLQTAFGYYKISNSSFRPVAKQESRDQFLKRDTSLLEEVPQSPSLTPVFVDSYLNLARRADTKLPEALKRAQLAYTKSDSVPVRMFFGSEEDLLETELVFEFHDEAIHRTYAVRFNTSMVFADRQVAAFPTPRSQYDLPTKTPDRPFPSGSEFSEQRSILDRMDPR